MKNLIVMIIGGLLIFYASFILSQRTAVSMESYLLFHILWAIWGRDLIYEKQNASKEKDR